VVRTPFPGSSDTSFDDGSNINSIRKSRPLTVTVVNNGLDFQTVHAHHRAREALCSCSTLPWHRRVPRVLADDCCLIRSSAMLRLLRQPRVQSCRAERRALPLTGGPVQATARISRQPPADVQQHKHTPRAFKTPRKAAQLRSINREQGVDCASNFQYGKPRRVFLQGKVQTPDVGPRKGSRGG
jgi:hypothetical protein